MEYDYPLLNKVFKYYTTADLDISQYRLYSCMHLLEPQLEMYKKFIEFGFKPENITALGKAYSSNKEIIQELKDLGIQVQQPAFSGQPFDIEHTENCLKIAGQMEESKINILLDDGGYLIEAAKDKKVYFGVEQTSSGFRKLENTALDFPIFNVARSNTKLIQESPLVARQIFERVTEYIKEKNIASPKIVILGLGPIGSATMQVLETENFDVEGFDIETTKEDVITHIKEEKPDIVVGATGTKLFDETDLKYIESSHRYYFMSVSSSDREFPVASFRNGSGVHSDVLFKNFVFVNNGFPITFKGYRNELTPIEIEKTICLLMGSVFHGITNYPTSRKGFLDVPVELQEIINQ